MDEEDRFATVQLVEDGVEDWVAQVMTVAVRQKNEPIATLFSKQQHRPRKRNISFRQLLAATSLGRLHRRHTERREALAVLPALHAAAERGNPPPVVSVPCTALAFLLGVCPDASRTAEISDKDCRRVLEDSKGVSDDLRIAVYLGGAAKAQQQSLRAEG